jgi:hypothetical protein
MSQIRVGQDVFDVGLSVARAEQIDRGEMSAARTAQVSAMYALLTP